MKYYRDSLDLTQVSAVVGKWAGVLKMIKHRKSRREVWVEHGKFRNLLLLSFLIQLHSCYQNCLFLLNSKAILFVIPSENNHNVQQFKTFFFVCDFISLFYDDTWHCSDGGMSHGNRFHFQWDIDDKDSRMGGEWQRHDEEDKILLLILVEFLIYSAFNVAEKLRNMRFFTQLHCNLHDFVDDNIFHLQGSSSTLLC